MKTKNNTWQKHLMSVKKANPKLTLSEAMKKASKSYTPKK